MQAGWLEVSRCRYRSTLAVVGEVLRPDRVGYPVFLERTMSALFRRWLLNWPAPFFHCASDSHGDLLSACVWEADVQDCSVVVCCHFHRLVYRLEYIWFHKLSLSEYPNGRAVAVEKLTVFR